MAYPLSDLSALFHQASPAHEKRVIRHLTYDSRRITEPEHTLFFALSGQRDGHDFLDEAYNAGVRAFVVQEGHPLPDLAGADWIRVPSPLEALQAIASFHREKLKYPLCGITGSNGKTVVKEWLFHLLLDKKNTARSPKSYNSQIGLPLSVWQLAPHKDLGLIEAGISESGEMAVLEKILKPEYGIFTSIGAAHDAGFGSRGEKIREKLRLFESVEWLVYPSDHADLDEEVNGWATGKNVRLIPWSKSGGRGLAFRVAERENGATISYDAHTFPIPFGDAASIENACTCLAFLVALEVPLEGLQEAFASLPSIDMRLQLKTGLFNSQLINDAYSADLSSLEIALQFLHKQTGKTRNTVILSSLTEPGMANEGLWSALRVLFRAYGVDQLLAVGRDYFQHRPDLGVPTRYFESTASLLHQLDPKEFKEEFVLIKGQRNFAFEQVVKHLEAKVHETVLEINLNALENNFRYYREKAGPGVKVMAMVKAQGYGSGSLEIAHQLQLSGADYLAVAYTDEGIDLRRRGISLPIMVMNAQRDSLAECIEFQLEPAVYDFDLLSFLQNTLNETGHTSASIHLEFDTGMHRLGFESSDISQLLTTLHADSRLNVASVFSHLAAADEARHDDYTLQQVKTFLDIKAGMLEGLDQPPLFHILNTAGIERFPQHAFDMVRPGIGLYGIQATEDPNSRLEPVASLKARISQIRELETGETVGYSRKGVLDRKSRVAVISVGYADGFRRNLSNGIGWVWINGFQAPVLGNVCMDMTMVDVSDIPCKEGDTVEVFGKNLPIETLARQAGTIPYEIITGISSRVNRVYWRE